MNVMFLYLLKTIKKTEMDVFNRFNQYTVYASLHYSLGWYLNKWRKENAASTLICFMKVNET